MWSLHLVTQATLARFWVILVSPIHRQPTAYLDPNSQSLQEPIEGGRVQLTYLESIRNSLHYPKRGRSVLAENQRISMLNFGALNKGEGGHRKATPPFPRCLCHPLAATTTERNPSQTNAPQPKKRQNDAKTCCLYLCSHCLPRKTYMDRHILLLFALMEVYLICHHHHNLAEYLFSS